MEQAIMCPQCNAPLAPHRFARSIVCSYCGATVQLDEASISAELFHKAYRAWNSPASTQASSWVSLGDSHWAIDKFLAQGETADVFSARRARWPTELAILKLLRDSQQADLFDNEWQAIQSLQKSEAAGAADFITLMPQPVIHGKVTDGVYAGKRASVFRRASGFRHTFEAVKRVYPQGVPPRASIWMWRRILEVLSFLHASGMVHGAVLPPHLLIQENEHGVRLVSYGVAGRMGEKLRRVSAGCEAFYPAPAQSLKTLTPQLDLAMSARCIAAVLGGDPADASVPAAVPKPLAEIIQRIARLDPVHGATEGTWALREELGRIADTVFGTPEFIPIVMPA